jgi:hypothetical protein
MPSPQEIRQRNQANQNKAAEDALYKEWSQACQAYDGRKPVTVRAFPGPVADAVIQRFKSEGWKVRNTRTGGRGFDEWELSE